MVDYWNSDIFHNPQCPHGPTLLFSRKDNNRKFYACSAFRDRKQCSFFLWSDAIFGKSKKRHNEAQKELFLNNNRNEINRLNNLSAAEKYYCHTCEKLFPLSEKFAHLKHEFASNIQDKLCHPTSILKAKTESKGQSQYYFSENTLNTISDFFLQLKITSVLCIGCPRFYEHVLNTCKNRIKSMLLDIDHRYLQFYDEDQFQWFNMFNCHAFDPDGWFHIKKFMLNERMAILIDPPFGGRIEPLAYMYNRLNSFFTTDDLKMRENDSVAVFLVLPYFMEQAVKQSFQNVSMLDYKVEYENHRKFRKSNDDKKRGSAVRIFTNVNASEIVLPERDGYKFCDVCKRWVCRENKHCSQCNACTSKNGGVYKHCKLCKKCVKETWQHCVTCKICKLPNHVCVPKLQLSTNNLKETSNSVKKRRNSKKNRNRKRKCVKK